MKSYHRAQSNMKEQEQVVINDNVHCLGKRPNNYVVLLVLAIWIGCSSITQVSNKEVISEGTSPLTLVCFQMLFGTAVFLFVSKHIRGNVGWSDCLTTSPKLHYLPFIVGLCNAITHTLTSYAMQMITPALTHITRGTEPIWMMTFSYLILQKEVSLFQVMSVVLMIIGVASIGYGGNVEESKSHDAVFKGIATTLAANVAISIRNCASKMYTQVTSKHLSYPEVCTYSFGIMALPCIAQYLLFERKGGSIYLLIASVFHVLYSTMSFFVLSFVEPASHSVIKLFSRTVVVISLTFAYGIEALDQHIIFGISMCISGALLYSLLTSDSQGFMQLMRKTNIKKVFLFIAFVSCLGLCLEITLYTGRSRVPLYLKNTYIEIEQEALREIEILDSTATIVSKYQLIPTHGYRKCLQGSPIFSPSRRKGTVYLGMKPELCEKCIPLNASQSFATLSVAVCQSRAIYCGISSTFICGLLAVSTKTTAHIDGRELLTWPKYMHDYDFKHDSVSVLERNHRLAFDRHTIQQSNALLKNLYNVKASRASFNILLYTQRHECDDNTNKRRPLKSGNMGDIFGSHLANYFSKKLNITFYIRCDFTNSLPGPNTNISLALVGSIARIAVETPNTILLGVGTISQDALIKLGPLRNDAYVMGVRGPLSRDAFLSKYGINPEVVGDPGLYLYEVFKPEVDSVRQNQYNMLDLCFISHEVEALIFSEKFPEYRNITLTSGGDIKSIVKSIAKCRAVVSSGLHGVIFSHALSIPSAAIKVSDKIAGGDWKFFDYYYGINVTEFTGRIDLKRNRDLPQGKRDWIQLVQTFPQPTFPLNVDALPTFQRFKAIFENRQ